MNKNRMTKLRLDIINAYNALEADWNIGGVLRDRPSNMRRMMSSNVQIHRMLNSKDYQQIKWTYDDLTECQKKIYKKLEKKFGLVCKDCEKYYYQCVCGLCKHCEGILGECNCCNCETTCKDCNKCYLPKCLCKCPKESLPAYYQYRRNFGG